MFDGGVSAQQSTVMVNIGTTFQKDSDRSTLGPADFAPLVTPTSSLLSEIAKNGGPPIPPETLVAFIVSFPLLRIDAHTLLHTRRVFESSADPAHAKLLQDRRVAELQDLFARFHAAPPDQVQTLKDRQATAKAAALVMSIIDGAKAFAEGGPNQIHANGLSIGFLPLH
jgi:hypothetical protein